MSDQVLIPRLIHVVWIGPKPFPYADYLATWGRLNPGWEVRFWTDRDIYEFGLENRDVYDRIPVWSIKSDIIRLELLARLGGLYSDADSWCLRPIDDLVAGYQALAMTGNRGRFGPGTMACAPGHPAFVKLAGGIRQHYKRLRAQRKPVSIHKVFAAGYINRVLPHDPTVYQVDKGARRGTQQVPRRLICSHAEIGPETYIAHNSANSWRDHLGGRNILL